MLVRSKWRVFVTSRCSLTTSSMAFGRMPKEQFMEQKTPGKEKEKKLVAYFRKMNAWPSQSALASHLFSNIVYHEPGKDKHGLVVLNKPHGLPLHPSEDSLYSLTSSLKSLADMMEVKSLKVIKTVDRWSSGITVLGTEEKTIEAFKKCSNQAKAQRMLASAYLCLAKGHSNMNRTETVQVRLVDCPHVANPVVGSMHKEPQISRKISSHYKNMKEQAKRVHVHCSTLSNSSKVDASLVCLEPSSVGHHFIPVYLADSSFPLLGDPLYDYRTRTLLGHKVKLTTAHTESKRCQVLPPSMLDLMGLQKGEEWEVPRMVHLHRLHLSDWLGKGTHVTIFAPPPEYFLRTCQTLGIAIDYSNLAETDSTRLWKPDARKKKKKALAKAPPAT